MKKITVLILTAILAWNLCGCWNYRELESVATVTGMAIDKTIDGKWLITAEIVDFNSGDPNSSKSTLVQSQGETFFDTIRNMIEISTQKLYWSHTLSFVISVDVAKDGIADLIDWISRNRELRQEAAILVSKAENARDVFNYKTPNFTYRSFAMYSILRSMANVAKAPPDQVHLLPQSISGTGKAALLPLVGSVDIGEEKVLSIAGSAYFRADKLTGFLSPEETFYWSLITDQVKGGIISIQYGNASEESRNYVALEIKKNKAKIEPKFKNSLLSFKVKIDSDVTIGDVETKEDIFTNDGQTKFKEAAQKNIESACMKVIQTIQAGNGPDIFGFGSAVKSSMPALWKSIEKEWPSKFPTVEVSVESKLTILHAGETQEEIKVLQNP